MSCLKIEGLSLRAGEFRIKNLHLDVADNQYFVIMGPTGSGKSLLLKAICGLIKIESGSISINGKDIASLPPGERAVGYVPQDSSLFPHMNVLDNIIFPLVVSGISKEDAVKETEHAVQTLGIGDLLDRSVRNLSGGETQKVALARALARNPLLLILDEPVSAVDEPTRKEICAVLHGIQVDFSITTLHVCHSIDEARLVSDNVGVMFDGEMLETGTISDLKKSSHPQILRLVEED